MIASTAHRQPASQPAVQYSWYVYVWNCNDAATTATTTTTTTTAAAAAAAEATNYGVLLSFKRNNCMYGFFR